MTGTVWKAKVITNEKLVAMQAYAVKKAEEAAIKAEEAARKAEEKERKAEEKEIAKAARLKEKESEVLESEGGGHGRGRGRGRGSETGGRGVRGLRSGRRGQRQRGGRDQVEDLPSVADENPAPAVRGRGRGRGRRGRGTLRSGTPADITTTTQTGNQPTPTLANSTARVTRSRIGASGTDKGSKAVTFAEGKLFIYWCYCSDLVKLTVYLCRRPYIRQRAIRYESSRL